MFGFTRTFLFFQVLNIWYAYSLYSLLALFMFFLHNKVLLESIYLTTFIISFELELLSNLLFGIFTYYSNDWNLLLDGRFLFDSALLSIFFFEFFIDSILSSIRQNVFTNRVSLIFCSLFWQNFFC